MNIDDVVDKIQDEVYAESDEAKLEDIEICENDQEKYEIAKSLQTDEAKIKAMKMFKNPFLAREIRVLIQSDEGKLKLLKDFYKDKEKSQGNIMSAIAKKIQNDEKKIEAIKIFENVYYKCEIAKSLQTDEAKIEVIKILDNEENKVKVAQTFKNDDEKFKFINCIANEHLINKLAKSIQNMENINLLQNDKKLKVLGAIQDTVLFREGINNLEYGEILKKLYLKNENIIKTLNYDFLTKYASKLDEEKLLRITNYPHIQSFMIRNNNKYMTNAIEYLMEHDTNWVIGLDTIVKNEIKFNGLFKNLMLNKEFEITEEFTQQFLSVVSDTENYFDIKNAHDINNYFEIKNNTCMKILRENTKNIPEKLKDYDKQDLYKFALLEYQFGISLEEAKRLVDRYGIDSKDLPKNNLSNYLNLLKDITQCDHIEDVTTSFVNENNLPEHWEGFPNARNSEGEIINLFIELYNETLYKTNEKDKNQNQAIYIDKNGKQHNIDVYTITDDFNMNIRGEGAYVDFVEPDDFNQYYARPNIDTHGNCESYIGNDSIALAEPSTTQMYVGYSNIRENSLTASGPYDLCSANNSFSNYHERSEFRVPKQMIDNTRHNHNEMVKERLVIDEKGNVSRYTPDYIVWVENDTKEEKNQAGWKEKRENDEKWTMTKKAAHQLGIPIVVIDREYFAERETEKIELMQKLFKGDEIDINKYGKYLEQYKNLSKPELILEMITKFENNATGMLRADNLNTRFFTQEQLEDMIQGINNGIERLSPKDQKECLHALASTADKERSNKHTTPNKQEFYSTIMEQTKEKLNEFNLDSDKYKKATLLQLYISKDTNRTNLAEAKQSLRNELLHENEKNQSIDMEDRDE